MNKKRSCQNVSQLATHQQLRKKGSFVSRTRSSLNLPPLVTYQKLNTYDRQDDINQIFLKLSALYSNLRDPLKEQLLRCACEDQGKNKEGYTVHLEKSNSIFWEKRACNLLKTLRSVIVKQVKTPFEKRLNICLSWRTNGFKVSYFDMFTMNELPQEAYSSPQPDHMPLVRRFFSNKAAKEHRALSVYRQDAPMATIVARWTPKSMSTQHDQKSVLQELARFGEIESVTSFGRQTVIVLFREIRSACKAISAFPSNGPERSMRCFWHHKFMSKYDIPKL